MAGQDLSNVYAMTPYLTTEQRRKLYGSQTEGIVTEQQWYNHYIEKLMALRYTVFKWINLPDYIPIEYLERVMLLTGTVAFIKDEKFGIQAMAISATTEWTLYGEMKKFNVQPLPVQNGGTITDYPMREFTAGVDAVVIRNDPDGNDEMTTIGMYARQLAKIRKQQAVNVDNQETTKIFLVDNDTVLTAKTTDSQMRNGASTIFTYKRTKNGRITDKQKAPEQPLYEYATPAEYVAGNLQELHDAIWSEALTKLGVNNVNIRKKERLVVSEAESNNDEVNMNSELQFEMRLRGCEEVERVLGIKINVEKNGMLLTSDPENPLATEPEKDEVKDDAGDDSA